MRAGALGIIPDSIAFGRNIDYTTPITRIEFAGIMVRVFEVFSGTAAMPAASNPFSDTDDINASKAFNAGIMIGFSETEFMPDSLLNREQAATALTRVYKRTTIEGWSFAADADFSLSFARPAPFADDGDISDWARESVYFMASHRIILGIGGNRFVPRATTAAQEDAGVANTTREQAIAIALRLIENLL